MKAYERALRTLLASTTRPKLGLLRMGVLLSALGDPHVGLRFLHVAGTKGKGSTCAFAASITRALGMRTGLTTSPHLCTARERIVVDGEMISERDFAARAAAVERACARRPGRAAIDASFFEKMIAMAFLHFRAQAVDVAVVEVGLGGRLDATNVIRPAACGITRLGLDHTEFLGPTLEHIAFEKAGIMKAGVPCVSSPQEPAAAHVLREHARERSAPLTFVDVDAVLRRCGAAGAASISLAGAHQRENAAVAVALVRAAGIAVPEEAARRALASTVWPGRYEAMPTTGAGDDVVVVDGAHNDTAAAALAATVTDDPRFAPRERGTRVDTLIVAMTQGRDVAAFGRALAPLLPRRVFAVPAGSPRALAPRELARALAPVFGVVEPMSVDEALARRGARTLVTGSLYVVGQVRHRMLRVPMDPEMPLF